MSRLQIAILAILSPILVAFFLFLNSSLFLFQIKMNLKGQSTIASPVQSPQVYLPSDQVARISKPPTKHRLSKVHLQYGKSIKLQNQKYLIKTNPTLPKYLPNGSVEFKVKTNHGTLIYTIPKSQVVVNDTKSLITNRSDSYQPSYVKVEKSKK
jgi:hypothetical protein